MGGERDGEPAPVQLQGLHHITMITGDAQRNVDFYADVLGLRLVKQTVNFDQPDAYHLYFGDELGTPGSLLTWFEFRDAARGRAGAGMVHLIQLAVASEDSLDFWERRLASRGYASQRGERSLRFGDYDGLALELLPAASEHAGPVPAHPEIAPEHAIVRIAGARAYAAPGRARSQQPLLGETLAFSGEEGTFEVRGQRDAFRWSYDEPPPQPGYQGAGTVHHIAWAARDEQHLAWRERLLQAGAHVTPVLDREYFRSIYFREGNGVLFEIATLLPGFAVDEDPAHLGESLRLPAQHEHLRAQLQAALEALENPRARVRTS